MLLNGVSIFFPLVDKPTLLKRRALNDNLILIETAIMDLEGLPTRQWFEHLVVVEGCELEEFEVTGLDHGFHHTLLELVRSQSIM